MDGSSYVITASAAGADRHPGWFFNVRSNPHVTIQVKDRQMKALAEVAGPEKKRTLWTNGSAKKPFYPYIPVSVPFHLHQTAQPDL